MISRSVVDVLRDHPTVTAVANVPSIDGTLVLVVAPSPPGLKAYRLSGRRGLAAAWTAHLGLEDPPLSLPSEWRLAEAADTVAAAKLAVEPLPHSPDVESTSSDPEGRVHYDLRVPLELAVFRGHFPSVPIVPGVEQVGWAISYARRHFGKLRFKGLSGLKFRRIVQPADRLRLTLVWSEPASTLHFSYVCNGRECTVGRVTFESRNV